MRSSRFAATCVTATVAIGMTWATAPLASAAANGPSPHRAAAAAQAANPSYIESGSNTVATAEPAVTLPNTRHCTVTLADHFMSNSPTGAPQNYSGTLTPPKACQGPWAKVVLNSTTSVSGRQYDRSGSLEIGGATVWFGTTQEPAGATPTTFSFAKDITEFTSLLKTPQQFSGGIGNYVTNVYTGNYDQTVSITYYMADRANPAPTEPDKVIGVPISDLSPGNSTATATLTDLPRNITGARLETTLKGNGCDEQWFTAVPNQVAADFPGDGLCAAGAYREALVSVDGTRAGAVGTFPHIYSGGIVPTLWRPVLAIDTLDLRPESLDLTPFAGQLVDGKSHTISVTINPIGDVWNVTAVLFLYTDHHLKQTSGGLISSSVPAAPTTKTTAGPLTNGSVTYDETASRADTLTGYVNTSAGRVVTTVTTNRNYDNSGTIGDAGLVQSIKQTDDMSSQSVSRIGRRIISSSTLKESYPISVDFSAASYVDDNNFSLSGTVDMSQIVASATSSTGQRWPTLRAWDWNVSSYGVLARANGVTSESDGHSTTSYVGTNDIGRFYWDQITTDHGQVTSNKHS
ncbi:peptide-N4-asparagine amidase [Rudaeicoccus suwonensis]|uniref:Peptide N-acetyl-beta-D-glucosaminyl asparaginase amidase A n=1 Tax=Rudaeicoccus suwonensis TaxID=657409 RepID=A0A561E3I4_9MICO|nr:peptide-N4-asparagine amidase [Rudaeicoccus suwonensis]TWE10175.1 peptide N-acetyl-beta-D-glucosaminyl asparaginase amidase A [Rudaeicoccus suwonensis]